MADWGILERAGVQLAVRDFGGDGPAALLLHGLAGHAEEWTATAAWLTGSCHVLALDARGHGRSERDQPTSRPLRTSPTPCSCSRRLDRRS